MESFIDKYCKKYNVAREDVVYLWKIYQNHTYSCKYIYTKGKKEGQFCSVKTKGTGYCSRHSNCELCGQKINISKPVRIRGNIIK